MQSLSRKEQVVKELARAAEERWGQQAVGLRQDLETTAEALSRIEDFHPQLDQEPPLLTSSLEALLHKSRNGAVR